MTITCSYSSGTYKCGNKAPYQYHNHSRNRLRDISTMDAFTGTGLCENHFKMFQKQIAQHKHNLKDDYVCCSHVKQLKTCTLSACWFWIKQHRHTRTPTFTGLAYCDPHGLAVRKAILNPNPTNTPRESRNLLRLARIRFDEEEQGHYLEDIPNLADSYELPENIAFDSENGYYYYEDSGARLLRGMDYEEV